MGARDVPSTSDDTRGEGQLRVSGTLVGDLPGRYGPMRFAGQLFSHAIQVADTRAVLRYLAPLRARRCVVLVGAAPDTIRTDGGDVAAGPATEQSVLLEPR